MISLKNGKHLEGRTKKDLFGGHIISEVNMNPQCTMHGLQRPDPDVVDQS